MDMLIGFFVSVAAGVIANYISKWFDRRGNGRKGQ